MIRKAIKILKILLFITVVLLLGQTTFGGETIAARFQELAKKGFVQGGEQLVHTKLLAGFSGSAVVERWLHNLNPPADKGKSAQPQDKEKDAGSTEPEEFNPADRDTVLRILQ